MRYDLATPIALDVWKDPQNYVITHHVRDEAWCYFRCWQGPAEDAPYIGCLHFQGVWHISSTRYGPLKGYPNVADTDLRSYYLIVEDSRLLKSLKEQRAGHDPDWQTCDPRRYGHYIVESHDFYSDLIAEKATCSTVEGVEAQPLFDLWDRI